MRRLAVAVAVVLAVGACGGEPSLSGDPSSAADGPVDLAADGEPLTLDQATVLSGALLADYQAQGAGFELIIPTPDVELRATGVVDWVGHQGHVEFDDASASSAGLDEAYWTEKRVVLPSGPADDPATVWTSRLADMRVPLDRSMAIITALAATAQDNPVLLQQSEARWLGEEDAGGERLAVYKHGGLVLWVGPDGRVRRAEGYVEQLGERISIEFHEYGPQDVAVPTPVSDQPIG